ncbi:type II CAAX endopeptidase family protein [Bacteroides sp. GD17]|jgi:membrane protease YdiL (CAAX protease family)|uniref:CPBP family intramembrane glutamic endopeptidase n=1 Tax=Bacteroides sp. GD17 TaxID=3139826 RepID=UPI00313E0F57
MGIEEKLNEGVVVSKSKRLWLTALDVILFIVLWGAFAFFITMPFSLLFKGLSEVSSTNVPLLILQETLLLVAAFLAAWILLSRRGRPLTSLGLSLHEGRWKDLFSGALFAVLLYAVGFGLSLLLGAVEVAGASFQPSSLLMALTYFFLVGVTEELVLRGFVLGRMLDGGVNKFWALFLSSAIFSLLHIFNPNFAFVPFLNILLAGLLLGASYIYTRNLCFPIALHWFWNWLQGPILGYEVSGNRFTDSLIALRLPEANLINGGAFGFEGSILCTVLMIVGTALIIGYYTIRQKTCGN